MVSVGTKLVSIKWLVTNKTIMKKQVGVFFFSTKLAVYFIVLKLSQCITAFHGCSLTVSYGASDTLMPEMINWGIVSVCVCVCLPVRAYPIYIHFPVYQSVYPSVGLALRLKHSSDTKPSSVLSSEMDGLGRWQYKLHPCFQQQR